MLQTQLIESRSGALTTPKKRFLRTLIICNLRRSDSHHPNTGAITLPLSPQFSGDRTRFRSWFCQVDNYLRLHATTFTSDTMRVGLFTSLLTDLAISWLMSFVESRSVVLNNYQMFVTELRRSFDDPNRVRHSSQRLKILRQEQFTSFVEYESHFRLLAHDVNWTDSSKSEQFREGLDYRAYARYCRDLR